MYLSESEIHFKCSKQNDSHFKHFHFKARGLRVGVGSLLASKGLDNIDESPVVLDPPLSATGLLFLLLSSFDLGSLSTDLTGTSERSVHLNKTKY